MQGCVTNLLQRIENNSHHVTAQVRDVITIGPFQALIDPSTQMTWLNYAVPIAPLAGLEVSESLLELRQVFANRHRTVRFEFTQSLWPTLPEALEQAGFVLEARQPMMLCTLADFNARNAPGVQVQLLTAKDDSNALAAYLSSASQGFGIDDIAQPPTAEEIDKLRDDLHKGRLRGALAYLNGAVAGVGCIIRLSEIGELAGVTTLPEWRRRGIASTLSSFLVQNHFDQGGEVVWLSAGDTIAQATYERIGFRLVDLRLNYIDATVNNSQH